MYWGSLLHTFRPLAGKKAVPGCHWGGSGAGSEKHLEMYEISDPLQRSGLSSRLGESLIFNILEETQKSLKTAPKTYKKLQF